MKVKVEKYKEKHILIASVTHSLEGIGDGQRGAVTDVIFFVESIGFLTKIWRPSPKVSIDSTCDPKTQEAEHSQAHEDNFL